MARARYIDTYGQSCFNTSSSMWQDCPSSFSDKTRVVEFYDDFLSTNIGNTAVWTLVQTGGTATQADLVGGALALTCGGNDNDTTNIIALPQTAAGGGYFRIAPNSGLKLWFEARISVDDIAEFGIFVGLTTPLADSNAEQLADNNLLMNVSVLADMVGFFTGEGAASAVLKFQWAKNGTLDADGLNNLLTLTASGTTYHTIGFAFDGVTTVTVWVNNAIVGYVNVSDANWPDDEFLVPGIGCKVGAADGAVLNVDYVRCVQLRA